MHYENTKWFKKGIKNGIPIALGYLAVAFTLGIAAKNAGLNGFSATLASLTTNASAGEFAAFTIIAAGGTYLELVIMEIVANIRYVLMSCALSQKLSDEVSLKHRLLIGFGVTDEIFGVSISTPQKLNPFYSYGLIAIAVPGWAIGTYFGVLFGNVLPADIVSALSVGLYGMFIAIIVPPARKNKIIAGLVIISMVLSYVMSELQIFSTISSGMRIIILTVLLSGAAAILFPIKENNTSTESYNEK